MSNHDISGIEIFPGIIVIDDAVPNCEDIIKLATSDSNGWKDAEIFISGQSGTEVNKEYRDTNVYLIDTNNPFWNDLCEIIFNYADQYAKIFDFSFSEMELPQILFYEKGFGKYNPHIDSCSNAPRIMSALLYLNDVYSGGETYFNKIDISIEPKAGRLVLFPSDYVFSHAAKIPTSNEKFSLVTWFKP